ncbi:Respiratory supercomplex factor 1, mitochondrial [Malassezia vespertilionis]|uniref:Rcf1p n=1 Tax=Malassezia vespertilionis TaxID=2020962 RepID=A0A2N1J991_9BASI|nr:Respiratory supercomplex factor 1, mitochondrial [Malassezia vespertilionis]PKI83125.1 Rcf1p [Malassezia vespertilionis]WFD07847.1 Respiratory supercomplex factor 1, mitochondrial [Malassezia vespertilionis]
MGDDTPFFPTPLDDEETGVQKLWRKCKKDPMIPIGSLLTCCALGYASMHLRSGNRDKFQSALRWRVVFQAVTVVAAGVSLVALEAPKNPAPDADGTQNPTPHWNQEKRDQASMQEEIDFRRRFNDLHMREERENDALQRMIAEAADKRESEAEQKPVRTAPKIGQDKRSFTFHT